MTTPSSLIPITAATHFPIRLTSHNFPVWRRQVQSTLIGLGLDGFLTADNPAPPKTITENATTKPNPQYINWHRQDQALFSAILGSCSDDIQPVIASATTAKEAWERLSTSFASTSRSRIISLKSKLAKNPKGDRPVAVFLHEMRSIADELALVQNPIDDEDLLVYILSQLGEEYNPITAALKVREQVVTYPELFDKLVDFERSLKESITPPVTLATANITQRQIGRSSFRSSTNHPPKQAPRNNTYSPQQPYLVSQSKPNTITRQDRNASFCNFCNIPGHDTRDCRKLIRFLKDHNLTLNTSFSNPAANTVTAAPHSHSVPSQWMMDSGASHHITSCPTNLGSVSDYGGPDEILLGDGSQNGGVNHAG